VKKIVLTDQLRNVQEIEKGTRKVHSVQDSLTRLRNSTSAEALSNLKDIILYQEDDVQKNLEVIIKTVANLSLSIEKSDRTECFRLMNIICSQKNRLNLAPFFSILLTYLKCAMTHIKPSIQEDSLSMLDILMKHFPQLVVAEKDDILIPYLDMMSKTKNDSSQERSITLHSSNKIMSIKWKKTILEQLAVLLKCLNTDKRHNDAERSSKNAKEIVVGEK
jgi:pre-rRNA-processing protein IPI1